MTEVRPAIRLLLLAAVVASWSVPAALARADEPPSPGDKAAFESGLSQYRQGNFVEAIKTWEALLATLGEERGYKVLYNLALAYHAVGDVTKAIDHYAAFESRVAARQDASEDLQARAADARSRREQLEQSYGAINVHAPRHGGLVLTRFGSSEPRPAGYVVWLSPGPHALELFVGTENARTVTVNVERGSTQDVDATPPEAAPVRPSVVPLSPPAQPSPIPAERAMPPWLWLGVGATVLSLAAPVGLYLAAHAKRDEADSLGPGNTAYGEALGTYDQWRMAYYVSYALPATLAAATLTYALWPRVPARPSRGAVSISPGGVALSLGF
jgi:tetratricopeptide (TPR) repeat protein